ncbi:OB-fold nucleic acid binding domain-containing protein [Sphingobium chungbukense]|uniref:Error-prone DNA polymerase n=1 Tax=Sphingobium chungbukense TaxID=56193 RepID=A0A0M3ATS6_9SPHN|nr:OB-fold nucleic acid binding domain-containing protein [Sphingobium chungbukense]KKW93235.1 hypothetical protein YP76_00555 [Sphingobium chungbukense]
MGTYVELQVVSHFSFLRGASSPEELFAAAALLGHGAMGLADWNTVAGVVRGWDGQKTTGVRMIPGARVELTDGRALLLYPRTRNAWSRLTRLLSLGKGRGGKGKCILEWADIAAHADDLVGILLPDMPGETTLAHLQDLRRVFGKRGYCALSLRRRPDDAERLHRLDAAARSAGVRAVATGDVLYHEPERRPLQDVVSAIREHCTIDTLGFRRERFMDRNLKSPEEMERRFRAFPDAIRATADIAHQCTFDLGEIQYQYPYEQVLEGRTAQQALASLTESAAEAKFPDGVPKRYRDQINHELGLIDQLGYAPYFLTVNSIVAESRRRGILCQGRGSAANSCVCYLLGITSIDPIQHELLFERFVSGERREPPDIDVDFEHERREEIIQWIYETYGRDRSALTAVVARYRTRGAVAEVGKALGLPRDLTKMLTGLVWGWSMDGIPKEQIESLNLNADDHRLKLTLDLARQLIGTPRHLSQHPGGFVLTQDRLDDLVPIEPARRRMTAGRDVVEDYRSLQLSLRGHPLQFLRPELDRMRIVRCADLPSIRDGRNIEVAGVILVRQRPGSAKGVLFVTIEDETGVAQGILWPNKFEIYRRQIMSASMIAMRGRLQKEGEVIHVICDRIMDHDDMLRSIGSMDFTVTPGRGDGASHGGGPDPRDPGFPRGRTLASAPLGSIQEQEELVRIRSHDFH